MKKIVKTIRDNIYFILALSLSVSFVVGAIMVINYNQHHDKQIIVNGIHFAIVVIVCFGLVYLQTCKDRRPKYTKTIEKKDGQEIHVIEEM